MKKIVILVEEPLILDYRPGVSNEHETLDYIPASRLRGAFYEALSSLGVRIDPEKLLGFGGPRWTNAWPADAVDAATFDRWVPLPKCPQFEMTSDQKGKKTGWGLAGNRALIQREVVTEIHMSVGRDYERRAHRKGVLYARTAISPDQYFVAYVDVDNNVLPDKSFQWNLGTRHSANGRCSVTISNSSDTFAELARPGGEFGAKYVAVQLLADAIIPGSDGGYLRGLDAAAFSDLIGCNVEVRAAYSSSKIVSGWSGKWNLPRESAVAIEAGSVWLIEFDSSHMDNRLDFIQNGMIKGLGIRTYEGYGTVAVNPEWLCMPDDGKIDIRYRYQATEQHPKFQMQVNDYSRLPDETRAIFNQLIGFAKDRANVSANDRTSEPDQARQWITAIARSQSLTDFLSLKNFVGDEAFTLIMSQQEDANRRRALLFYLNAFESELKMVGVPDATEQEVIG